MQAAVGWNTESGAEKRIPAVRRSVPRFLTQCPRAPPPLLVDPCAALDIEVDVAAGIELAWLLLPEFPPREPEDEPPA
jgi:hypothetical protein